MFLKRAAVAENLMALGIKFLGSPIYTVPAKSTCPTKLYKENVTYLLQEAHFSCFIII